MNPRIIMATFLALVVVSLVSACASPATPTPNVEGTVQVRVGLINTQTAVVQAQIAIAATQTAMAIPPATPVPSKPALTAPVVSTAVPAPTVSSRPAPTSPQVGVPCPFYVYADWGSEKNHYVPKGWMGDINDIQFDDNYKLDPARSSIIQIVYTPKGSNQWVGVYWWDPPDGDWGNKDGGFNLSCATKLTFWARGEKGGEKAELKVGGLKGAYQDSLQPALSTGPIVLTKDWKQYTLDLSGKNLSHIIGGLVWVTNKPSNPNGATIYLDDIRFE
jgi:hypothetical protein